MEYTGQQADTNIFATHFNAALERGRSLPPDFFFNVILEYAKWQRLEPGKLVFVLDEYETLFERLHLAALRDRELRFTVVQALLNQMVEFARQNLLILIGQRPDAHYIIMDQNQLSPYVRLSAFPLFEHIFGDDLTEFTSLLRKVLTERVTFDSGFADAVFRETGGHPYLTVNTMIDLFQWLIDTRRRANNLHLTASDFRTFADDRLTPRAILQGQHYEFFRHFLSEALSSDSRRHTPWLYAVTTVLQRLATEYPDTLSCPKSRFEEIAQPIAAEFNWEPDYLLNTAQLSNFLSLHGTTVGPTIPVLARVAQTARPKLA